MWRNLYSMNSGHKTMIIKKTLEGNKMVVLLDQGGELTVFVSPNDGNGEWLFQIRTDRKRADVITRVEIDLINRRFGKAGQNRVIDRGLREVSRR